MSPIGNKKKIALEKNDLKMKKNGNS